MNYSFIIHGETPSKKNSRINLPNGVSIPNERYREWHDMAQGQLMRQKRPGKPLEVVSIDLLFIHGDKRNRDSDNQLSSIFDLLQDCKIIKNDSWQNIPHYAVDNDYEKNNAKAIIKISC